MNKKLLFVVLFISSFSVSAQQSVRDSSISFFMLSPTFALQVPGADLAGRYGTNFDIGGSFSYKSKSNWIIGIEGDFIFGNDIKDYGLFDSISTNQGYLIGTGGTYADVRIYERGYHFNLKLGKLFPMWGPNVNSGLLTTVGVGFMQTKIRIETPSNDAPQVSGAYAEGYDQRINGLALTEFAGYQHLSNSGRINYFAGFEFIQGFTQNRRSYDFSTMSQDNSKHLDLLNGIRVGWTFCLYKRKPNDYYIY